MTYVAYLTRIFFFHKKNYDFFREFQLIMFISDNNILLSDQDTNQYI